MRRLLELLKGGPGSGNHGHGGRPGEVGGSTSSGGGGGGNGKGGGKKGKPGKKTGDEAGHPGKGASLKGIQSNASEARSEASKGKAELVGINTLVENSPGFNHKMKKVKGRFTGAAEQMQDAIDQLPPGPKRDNFDEKLERVYGKASSVPLGREKEVFGQAFNSLDQLAVQIIQHPKKKLEIISRIWIA